MPLDIPATIFYGNRDLYINKTDIEKWRDKTKACSIYEFNGDHFSIFNNLPHAAEIIKDKLFTKSDFSWLSKL